MRNFILRRLLQMIPVFLGVVVIVFFLIHSVPGGPLSGMIDPNMTAAQKQDLAEKMGLDQPIYVQFYNWLVEIFKGNFGYSYTYKAPVFSVIGDYIGPTFLLGVSSLVFSVLLGIPSGIISATKQYSKLDNTLTVLSLVGISMPSFFFALLLIKFFAIDFKIFPMFGMVTAAVSKADAFTYATNVLWHLVLPTIVLGLGSTASFMRFTRSAVLEVIRQDYIRTARAKGMKERIVIYRHALRNALIPIITLLGMWLPALFSGAVITESIFKWPGLGSIGVNAAIKRDYPLLMASNMMLSGLTLLGTLLADVFYSVADPRIKYD